ncbi:GGDEF domain-containing protein [Colwellia sp. E2M01]|uniref:GGDEF domain-containing protein n=1 Tax=Colwellia sp. E2M01 TaxID=2841561 RepID=UPI001C0929C5|nr:GGDEF domain-containing protein [Colwellia sp. E2M01]MBU2870766.1 GGDEF domain-containing protein [Colwellia sp. E2M01]
MTNNNFTSMTSDPSLELSNPEMLDDSYSIFKRGLLIRIMAITGSMTAIFAVLDLLGLHDLGNVQRNFNFCFSAANFIFFIILHKRIVTFTTACILFLPLCYVGCMVAVISVPNDEFRAIWFFLTMFYAYMLSGVIAGYVLTISAIIGLALIQTFVTETYSELSFATVNIALIFLSLSLSAFAKQMEKHRKQLRKQSRELHYLANKDPLTDVLNSKSHYVLGKSLLEEAKKNQQELSMLCVYIDNLSTIYQKHGSLIEEPLLAHVEKLMNAQLYNKGDIAKVSQQEFCILLPEYDVISAKSLANNISDSVQQHLFSTGKTKIPLTLSIGISTLKESDNEIRSIQVRADRALSKAKALGGNKILTYSI